MRLFILFLTILYSNIFAQISYGGIPKYYNEERSVEYIQSNRENIVDRNFAPMVFQYGTEYEMNVNILDSTEPIIDGEIFTYILGINSQDAFGIGLIFDDFYMSENSTLFLYDRDRTMFLGGFTNQSNKESNIFPTSIIKSDQIIIELNVPESELDIVRLNLGTIIHDYEDIMNYFTEENSNREDCNINVSCPESEGYENQINGTLRVTMGGGLCSGSLINNTLNDRTPYVLFADHCVSGSTSGYVFHFNYQSSTCNGTSGPQNQSVSGSTLKASADINSGPDFALLELTSNIPDDYNPFYVGWSKVSSAPQDAVGVHHPGGGIKKITQDGTNVTSNGYFWEFQYNDGRVIPGSSGSPFFDENKRQVGICSYIYTNYCDPSPDCYCDQQYSHGYGRFDLAWNMGLSTYLDPLNSGVDGIDGISISGINILHDPMEDIPFESNSVSIIADVSAYTGVIDAVELYYDIGDGWITQEMNETFGNTYEGVISGLYNGMIIEYYILAINSEGIVQYFPSNAPEGTILFFVGDFPDYYVIDFESGSQEWTVGDLDDDASAGIWELAEPIATFNDDGYQVQPGEDYTNAGSYCFVTGNAEDGAAGVDDVDNGKTTLISPVFDLSSFDDVILSYWYWYTNNIGDNGGNDLWQVLISDNGGNSWENILATSTSVTEWTKQRFILSDYIELTDAMQFKFIAEDISYNEDAGSGGSLVEAALDDFLIEYISSGSGVIGDVNNDLAVDVLDAVLVVNMILGNESPNYATADLNSDSQINVQDIILLINIILNN